MHIQMFPADQSLNTIAIFHDFNLNPTDIYRKPRFPLCIKHLVQRRQLPQEQEDETWTIIQRILADPPTLCAPSTCMGEHGELRKQLI
jgi:hypothetical protein